MRIVDVFLAFLSLLLALAIGAALGPSLTLAGAGHHLRVVAVVRPADARAAAAAIRRRTYVESSLLLGERLAGRLRHILPNAAGPVIVQSSLDLGGAIPTLAALSPGPRRAGPDPEASWSSRALARVDPPVEALAWASAIMLAALAFTLLGEGLRSGSTRRKRRADDVRARVRARGRRPPRPAPQRRCSPSAG
ncbi:MAG: hypothetical protein U0869_06090 [Chloroflexota bacterium]